MNKLHILIAAASLSLLTAGCSGVPVDLGARAGQPVPTGPSREIEANACGFQLLTIIPISINSRLQRAYAELQERANGDYITDVKVKESWNYAFVGTTYCTELHAKAIAAHT
jgi:hypothetical protein